MPEPWQEGGFGLYVHWPFCQSKCPYCDFNSHVVDRVDQRAWADALAAEIRRHAEETPGRVLGSVFFGGGTPSLMAVETVETVLEAARGSEWSVANDIEVTLEANPSSVEAGRFRGYRDAGVNRLSLGVQALREADLRRLGRLHSVADALRAIDIASEVFPRISIDLIYARQDQGAEEWRAELSEALAFGLDHYALYQLTIEPGTAFGERFARGGLRGLPDEDRSVDLWDVTQELCGASGLPGYEVSNHARPGQEARHNLIYWQTGDWVGVGPGAHGRLTLDGTRWATEALRQPGAWLEAVRTRGNGDAREVVPRRAWAEEALLMGLRTSAGVDTHRLGRIDRELELARLPELVDDGLLEHDGERLRATARGVLLLNSVVGALLDG